MELLYTGLVYTTELLYWTCPSYGALVHWTGLHYWAPVLDLSILWSFCTGLVHPTELLYWTCPSYGALVHWTGPPYWAFVLDLSILVSSCTGPVCPTDLLYWTCLSYWPLVLDLFVLLSSCTGLVCPTELICQTCPSYWILQSSHNALTIILITGLVHLTELLYWTCVQGTVIADQLFTCSKAIPKGCIINLKRVPTKKRSYLDKEIHTSIVSAQRNKSTKQIVLNYFKQMIKNKAAGCRTWLGFDTCS